MNGTEIEDTLVLNVFHVCEYIRDMVQGIGHQEIEAMGGLLTVLEVRERLTKLTPCLDKE